MCYFQYLARTEADSGSDSKQAAKSLAFNSTCLEYSSFLEGLLEAEETAVAFWLRTWAGVKGDPSVRASVTEEAQRENREKYHASIARSLGERLRDRVEVEDDGDAAESDAASEEGGSASATSGGSAISSASNLPRKRSFQRRRRSSIPTFGVVEHEGESAGDRFKGFLNKASQRISSATHQLSTATQEFSSRMPIPHSSTSTTEHNTRVSLSAPARTPANHSPGGELRRKEGLLFATRAAIGHTSAGDGGGSWRPIWCVLSEGKLVEFSNLKTLSMQNAPIDLSYSSVKVSKNTDRR